MLRKALGHGLAERELGKGLAALLPDPSFTVDATGHALGGITQIPIDKIVPNRYQPRKHFDPAKLSQLADSLKRHGLIQPIMVKAKENDRFELIAGERRWRASQLAGFSKIPAIIKDVQPQEMVEWALIENLQREDLNPLEKANAYAKLTSDFSLTQETVAARVGIDRSSVSNFLRLLQLPKEIWPCLEDGTVTMGHAKALLMLKSRSDQVRLARDIQSRTLSVRETEAWVKKMPGGANRKAHGVSSRRNDADIAAVEDRLRFSLGTRVRLVEHKKGGEIRISYASPNDRERILEKLLE